MQYERAALDKVLDASEAIFCAGNHPARMGQLEGELKSSMLRLFALAENYPDLKAQQSFQQLQQRVSGLESEIADRREFYNDSVNSYNIRINSIPDLLLARRMGFQFQEMYQVAAEDKKEPDLSIQLPKE